MKSKPAAYTIYSLAFLFFLCPEIWAQSRVNYQDLVRQQREQNIYFDFFTLPGKQDNTVQFVSSFRIDYSFLPFKKLNTYGENERFFSSISMSLEVFKAEEKVNNRRDKISIEGLTPVGRAFWQDTAYADKYQQTQSGNTFIGGNMQVELKPGLYNYLLQLKRNEFSDEETSRVRQVEIPPYRDQKNGSTILIENVATDADPGKLELLNFGDNVYYGKDFYAFVHLPDYDPQAAYSYKIFRIEVSNRDTTKRNQVLEESISQNQLLNSVKPRLIKQKGSPFLALDKIDNGFNYALFKVPNSRFPNAIYQLEVYKDSQKQPVSRSIFRSLWLRMPVSLLNLDVAIDMLRFIEERDTIRRMKEGSEAEREKKFREYWKSKDPTPETEFNELMAEYYRRVDYAYDQFSTINTVGYESDQGQVYIQYGPPQNVERRYPSGEPAMEVWTYNGSQQFVFQATSGFGDFELVSR